MNAAGLATLFTAVAGLISALGAIGLHFNLRAQTMRHIEVQKEINKHLSQYSLPQPRRPGSL